MPCCGMQPGFPMYLPIPDGQFLASLEIPPYSGPIVAANHENDTCFGNRIVMGSADCINYAGLVKTLENLFKRNIWPLSDTLQAGACIFPPFQISHDHMV